jgi:ESCRT-II complex subunit VPS22
MRKVGIAGLQRQELKRQEFNKISSRVKLEELEKYQKLLDKFQENIKSFSKKYAAEIAKDKEFRASFLDICTKIGVDPLSSSKGIWAFMGLGDYYYELLVKILEISLATSQRNGGLIALDRVKELLGDDQVSIQDLKKSLSNIQVLGNGLELMELNSKIYLGSVPRELNKDLLLLLEFTQKSFKINTVLVEKEFKWQEERVLRAIVFLMMSKL